MRERRISSDIKERKVQKVKYSKNNINGSDKSYNSKVVDEPKFEKGLVLEFPEGIEVVPSRVSNEDSYCYMYDTNFVVKGKFPKPGDNILVLNYAKKTHFAVDYNSYIMAVEKLNSLPSEVLDLSKRVVENKGMNDDMAVEFVCLEDTLNKLKSSYVGHFVLTKMNDEIANPLKRRMVGMRFMYNDYKNNLAKQKSDEDFKDNVFAKAAKMYSK